MGTKQIISRVAALYGVTPADILSNKKHRIFADCRTVICYVLCEGMGLPAIRVGAMLNRTHVTVLYHIAKGKDWLPDLLFFADDVQASGALMALQHHGVRIPEDVKVVTWANHGLGPVFWKSLARMEMDPYAHGATIAQYVLSFLRGHGLPDDAAIGPRYIDGDTFPA